jgi:hypothetical protein
MTYEIWLNRLGIGSNYFIQEVKASSPREALVSAGFIPDEEDPAFSGASPRNEVGIPWYPHFQAIPQPRVYWQRTSGPLTQR